MRSPDCFVKIQADLLSLDLDEFAQLGLGD